MDKRDVSIVNITETIKTVDVGSKILIPAIVAGISPGSVPTTLATI